MRIWIAVIALTTSLVLSRPLTHSRSFSITEATTPRKKNESIVINDDIAVVVEVMCHLLVCCRCPGHVRKWTSWAVAFCADRVRPRQADPPSCGSWVQAGADAGDDRRDRHLLLGAPGSGKSTFLNNLLKKLSAEKQLTAIQ